MLVPHICGLLHTECVLGCIPAEAKDAGYTGQRSCTSVKLVVELGGAGTRGKCVRGTQCECVRVVFTETEHCQCTGFDVDEHQSGIGNSKLGRLSFHTVSLI